MPVFSLFEKTYAVAGKIVSTFIDPPYNRLVGDSFTWDARLQQALANQLYSLPQGSLKPTWDAIRVPEASAMTIALNALATRAELVGSRDRAHLLRGALPHVDEIVTILIEVRQDPNWKHSDGLILPVLMGLLGDFDRAGEHFGAKKASVIHDETSEFSGLLSDAFTRAKAARPSEHRVNTGQSLRLGYSVLDSLSFVRSQDELLIQAADVLASALRVFACGENQGRQGHDRLWQSCSAILQKAADTSSMGCHMGGSEPFFTRLGRSIRAYA